MVESKLPRYSLLLAVSLIPLSASTCSANKAGLADRPWALHVIDDTARGADGVRLADITGEGLPDIATGFEEGGITRVFLHPGLAKAAENWLAVTVGKTPSVEDAVLADLDGDGFKDVVSCCEGKTRTIFVSWSPADKSALLKSEKWTQRPLPASVGRMQWMFATAMHIDGDNRIDLVAAGKNDNAQIGFFLAPPEPRRLDGWMWRAISPVGWVMSVISADMDGDRDPDIIISDRRGALRGCRWLENPGPSKAETAPWPCHFIGARDVEVMFMTLADLDGDGLTDVLVSAKKAQVLLFRRLDKSGDRWATSRIPYPDNMGSAKGVAAGDIDSGGRTDIVISCEHADPPKSGLKWLSCEGDPFESEWRGHELSGPAGIKFDRIELLDIDRDGDLDVLTCEERHQGRGLGVVWYENALSPPLTPPSSARPGP